MDQPFELPSTRWTTNNAPERRRKWPRKIHILTCGGVCILTVLLIVMVACTLPVTKDSAAVLEDAPGIMNGGAESYNFLYHVGCTPEAKFFSNTTCAAWEPYSAVDPFVSKAVRRSVQAFVWHLLDE